MADLLQSIWRPSLELLRRFPPLKFSLDSVRLSAPRSPSPELVRPGGLRNFSPEFVRQGALRSDPPPLPPRMFSRLLVRLMPLRDSPELLRLGAFRAGDIIPSSEDDVRRNDSPEFVRLGAFLITDKCSPELFRLGGLRPFFSTDWRKFIL